MPTTVPYRVRAEIAFATDPLALTPAWADQSAYLSGRVQISRGRQDQFSKVQPSRMSMVLDNSDGRFTAELVTGANYPNVKKGKRVRVTVRAWDHVNNRPTNPGNLLTPQQSTFEINAVSWVGGGAVPPATARNTTRSVSPTVSMMSTWGTGLGTTELTLAGLVKGRTYTFSAYLYVPTGLVDFRLGVSGIGTGTAMSTKDAFTRMTFTFVATANSHLLQLTPVSATTAGQQTWMDNVQVDEGSTVGTFTTTTPDVLYRFDGFVDEWPVEWEGGPSKFSKVQVTATDRQARLNRTLSNAIEEWMSRDGAPVGHWPLNESDALATSFAPVDTTCVGSLVTTTSIGGAGAGAGVTAGTSIGPDTDGFAAPTFDNPTANQGKFLHGQIVDGRPTTALSFGAYFVQTTNTLCSIAAVGNGTAVYDSAMLVLRCDSANTGIFWVHTDGSTGSLNYAADLTDGTVHHIGVVIEGFTTGSTIRLYVDGTQRASTTVAVGRTVATVGDYVAVGQISPVGITNMKIDGTVAHVGLWDYALSSEVMTQLGNLRRRSTYTGYSPLGFMLDIMALLETKDPSGLQIGSSLLQFRDWTGKTVLGLIEEIMTSDGSIFFYDASGRPITHMRSHRYNPIPVVTLATGEYGEDSRFQLDDSQLVNDVTINQVDGITVRVKDRSSQAAYDVYGITEESTCVNVNDILSAAQWRVNTYKEPMIRLPSVEVDWGTLPGGMAEVGLLEISACLRLTGLPTQAPASTFDVFIEGYTEEISPEEWVTKYNASPVVGVAAWVLDSTTLSQLDSTIKLAY